MSLTDLRPRVAAPPARWLVSRLERPSGFARVDRHGAAVRVLVGDEGGGPGARDHDGAGRGAPVQLGRSVVTAEFGAKGDVVVETCSAPPALLVSGSGTQLLPATPGLRRPARMSAGDILLLCSASALDAPPVGLVEILKAPAREVLAMSQRVLLDMILGDQTDGAAAIVTRAGLEHHIDDGKALS